MAIPTDHTMIWTEVYTGIPGKPRTKCVEAGWCAFPKNTPEEVAARKASEYMHKQFYWPLPGKGVFGWVVLTYPEDRCAKKFKASDRILGIFG